MDDTMVDIFDSVDQNNDSVDIIPMEQIFDNVSSMEEQKPVETVTHQNSIDNQLFVSQNNIDNQVTQTTTEQIVEQTVTTVKQKDKILRIQIILIVVWLVLTVLLYFFGYGLFEPFIKID